MRQLKQAGDLFGSETFPCTSSRLVDEYGDQSLELENGETTVGELFETLPDAEFETCEDALEAAYGVVGEEAIGRKGYSDRDPPCPGEDGYEPVSF